MLWCTRCFGVALAQTENRDAHIHAPNTAETTTGNGKVGESLADLTVRAPIAFDQLPQGLVRPLIGLRTRGIDVLGKSPESLARLFEDSTINLNPAERDALTLVLGVMQDVRATAFSESNASTGGQTAQIDGTAPATVPSRPAPLPLPPMALPPAPCLRWSLAAPSMRA